MRIFFIFASLIVVCGFAAGLVAQELGYFSQPGLPANFIVQKGENFVTLARQLKAAGIIRNERAFRWYVNFFGPRKGLKRGEFGLYQNMPIPEVIRALTQGKPIEYKVTIPEGFNLYQIADVLAEAGLANREAFIEACKSPQIIAALPTITPADRKPKTLEGYLYPDTYLVQKVETPLEIVQSMVHHFKEVNASLAPQFQNSAVMRDFHFTPHQVVVLASIVEKETGAAAERPLIASVFLNRLRKRMRLQTDPTIIYGLYLAKGSWDGNIHKRDLLEPTPYNTYQIDGLPPGPISNPSKSAIEAVLNPANTDFLYFVSGGNGTHVFSKDYSAHAKAVRETQLKPGIRAGKSWRNLPAEQRAR